LLFGPHLAILVWWLYNPIYSHVPHLDLTDLGWIFLPWTMLMYITVGGDGIIRFNWIVLWLGVFTDMASYFGIYAERRRIP